MPASCVPIPVQPAGQSSSWLLWPLRACTMSRRGLEDPRRATAETDAFIESCGVPAVAWCHPKGACGHLTVRVDSGVSTWVWLYSDRRQH